jgi:hypothetical protein
VQGAVVLSANRQPKSFSALAMSCDVGSKLGGLMPGTPPNGVGRGPKSQMSWLPFPNFRFASIWTSGRALGSWMLLLEKLGLGSDPLVPGLASMTMKKPKPFGRV